jgi:hypothetical protein
MYQGIINISVGIIRVLRIAIKTISLPLKENFARV